MSLIFTNQKKVRTQFRMHSIINLFVTSKIKFSNSPLHEFKVLQNVSKIKKEVLKCFFKVINKNEYYGITG
jgi:hypothetical protein